MSTASVSLFIRSATSGIAASSSDCCSAVGGSATSPAAAQEGQRAGGRSPRSASSRMCAALIASHFLRSKRAGLGLTSRMSNAATISSMEKTSRSAAIDQPSSAR